LAGDSKTGEVINTCTDQNANHCSTAIGGLDSLKPVPIYQTFSALLQQLIVGRGVNQYDENNRYVGLIVMMDSGGQSAKSG
jgi:hypothetical protein